MSTPTGSAAKASGSSPAAKASPTKSPRLPGAPSAAAPSPGGPNVRPGSGPRTVRLSLGRLDPWSTMKISFLLSVALGISLVVAVAVLWLILQAMGVFDDVNTFIATIQGTSDGKKFNLMDYVGFGRVVSLGTVIAVIDVFLLTAIATLWSYLYNICASLVGGVQLTLTDE